MLPQKERAPLLICTEMHKRIKSNIGLLYIYMYSHTLRIIRQHPFLKTNEDDKGVDKLYTNMIKNTHLSNNYVNTLQYYKIIL